MSSGSAFQPTLATYAIVAIVVVRFLFRELRRRTISVRTLWIRPAILVALLALILWGAFAVPGASPPFIALAFVVGAALGVVTGLLVARSTTFAPSGRRGTVFAQGNAVTVIVWVCALALRLLARFVVGGAGATVAQQMELNVGLLALVAAAFGVVALEFHRAIDRLAPEGAEARAL
jgi:hypothetical protein